MANCILEGQEYRRSEVDEKLAEKANSSHTHTAATTTANGFMSSTDKTKLNGIATGATANSASSTTPKVAGTAAVGTETAYARGDHVHPAQTSVSGNAGTATKLATGRTIRTNLASTSTSTFDGSANITPGVTGILPIANGGTGASSAATARTNLDVYSKSEVDARVMREPDWWKSDTTADTTWFTNLHNYLTYASARALTIPLGLKKKVTLTSSVLGTTEHYIMVIGRNIDADKTLTFQTANNLLNTTTFGSSAQWIGSTARTQCQNYYNAFPGKSYIKTVSKGTNTEYNTASVLYSDETVWLPSIFEMGLGAYSGEPKAAEYTNGKSTPYPYYVSDTSRIKATGSTFNSGYYWTRSRCSSGSGRVCLVGSSGFADWNAYGNGGGLAPAFVLG